MNGPKRKLLGDFVECVGLPPRDPLLRWAKEHYPSRGFTKNTYSPMKKLQPVSSHCVLVLVHGLRARENSSWPQAAAFERYLEAMGFELHRMTALQLLNAVSEIVPSHAASPFESGIEPLVNIFEKYTSPADGIRPALDADEVRRAVPWLFIDGGRRFGPKRLSPEKAIRLAEYRVRQSMDAYADRLVRWHCAVPWSIAVLDTKKGPSAISVAAPIAEDTYRLIRDGKQNMHDPGLDLDPLVQASSFVFIETMAPNPAFHSSSHIVAMWWMFRLAAAHQARLSDVPNLGRETPLRIITTGCTTLHCRWLKCFGYEPVGHAMPGGARFPLFERILHGPNRSGVGHHILGVWSGLQDSIRKLFGAPHI